MSPDVIVVGGGVIGTAVTYRLAKEGLKVTLLERAAVGRQATAASAGLIMPHRDRGTPEAFAALMSESARLYPSLADELGERTGIDVGFRPVARLDLALSESDELELRRQAAWEADHRTGARWLDHDAALDAEPWANPNLRGGVYHEFHQVLPLLLAQALARAAADLGADVREGVAVDRLLAEGDRIAGVGFGLETLRADETVVATGAWSAAWGQPLAVTIPVRPRRGQMVALQTPSTAMRVVLAGLDGFVLSKPDGRTLVGVTVEDVGFDARPTVEAVRGMLERAARLSPRLADATVLEAFAGLRPGTPDDLPIIGRVDGWRGITLGTGHFRNGILLAPITSELILDLIARRTPRLAIDAFQPGRFLVRAA